jgi:hypothetical protein
MSGISMRYKLACFTSSLVLMAAAQAATTPVLQRVHGEYSAEKPFSTSMRMVVVGDGDKAGDRLIAAEILVGTPGCSGSFTGVGTVEKDRIILRTYKPKDPSEACTVTVEVNKTGKAVTLSESNCSYYHGAACEFSGTLTSK